MGFWGKSESKPIDELSAKEVQKVLKGGKIPGYDAKQLKQMQKDLVRRTAGERGMGALAAGMKDAAKGRSGSKGAAMPKGPVNRDGSPRSSWW